MRATLRDVAAARTEIEQLLSLPSGYQRDLQFSKGGLVHGFGRGLAALELLPDLLRRIALERRSRCARRSIRRCTRPISRSSRRLPECRFAKLIRRAAQAERAGCDARRKRSERADIAWRSWRSRFDELRARLER